ncbi:N-terminal glutamine amidase-domain-containing protein [Lentinula guzmanii]|uniref:Protein N-terminal glutamine amidohydrolase n=1 Tax=Lentinula guzmanii TaxID=2804957 RepID=A0AA38JN25_9AGAR|nr:N-terminal glutamine amidase-domain-containing protein [Lentinula guzmanii]
MSLTPPELPQDAAYTPYWCEENVYLLIQSFLRNTSLSEIWEVFAVFISNHSKTVALWNQKLSKEPGQPVIWDYHVVAVLRPRKFSSNLHSWVYDLDTRLDLPVTWNSKLERSYSSFQSCQHRNNSLFRVVSANVYLDRFASDRSHMLARTPPGTLPNPNYLQPAPPYPPLRGPQCMSTHNLMNFVSMLSFNDYGDVFDIKGISGFFA